ncbi:hypothetical protein OBK05_03670 [Empedobacter falsenii]
MHIQFTLDTYFYNLFPEFSKDHNTLIKEIEVQYTIGGIKPEVSIIDNVLHIKIDNIKVNENAQKLNTLIKLCETNKFEEAIEYANSLINEDIKDSELFRIYGQLLSDKGNNEEAINYLIESLRLNPNNTYALLMVGNIYNKHYRDIDTAKVYYNRILELDDKDFITLTNLGFVLIQSNDPIGINYIEKALEINSSYSNAHLAKGMYHFNSDEFELAFNSAIKAVNTSKVKDQVYASALDLSFSAAKKKTEEVNLNVLDNYIKHLGELGGKKIEFQQDDTLAVLAKIEIAENYNRDHHLVKYKPSHGYEIHLILHELIHLEYILEARLVGDNKLFTTSEIAKNKFRNDFKSEFSKVETKGYPKSAITQIENMSFDGINLLMYNCPIDIFIEDKIYKEYPQLRYTQYLSLFEVLNKGLKSVTDKQIIELFPKKIVEVTKILNIVQAYLFKELFNLDLIQDFKASKNELAIATGFYNEFLEYRLDRHPGEEYELIENWSKDLNINNYFKLIDDSNNVYLNMETESAPVSKSVDEVLKELEEDPYGLNDDLTWQEKANEVFKRENTSDEVNLAVAMYMVDAINFYSNYNKDQIKKYAFDWATLGMMGINPQKNNYSLPSIENKLFSGYKALAYYYVAWAIALPEMLAQLGMPFDKEYELAKNLK